VYISISMDQWWNGIFGGKENPYTKFNVYGSVHRNNIIVYNSN